MSQNVEAFDSFFNIYDKEDYQQYIITQDEDLFHTCNAGWDLINWQEKAGLLTALMKCEDCKKAFKVTYTYAFTETYKERDGEE